MPWRAPANFNEGDRKLAERCREIATRLLAGGPSLADLKQQARVLEANHLAERICRLEDSVEKDPSLAIGTAKELILLQNHPGPLAERSSGARRTFPR